MGVIPEEETGVVGNNSGVPFVEAAAVPITMSVLP
jgi:hypothetical protein